VMTRVYNRNTYKYAEQEFQETTTKIENPVIENVTILPNNSFSSQSIGITSVHFPIDILIHIFSFLEYHELIRYTQCRKEIQISVWKYIKTQMEFSLGRFRYEKLDLYAPKFEMCEPVTVFLVMTLKETEEVTSIKTFLMERVRAIKHHLLTWNLEPSRVCGFIQRISPTIASEPRSLDAKSDTMDVQMLIQAPINFLNEFLQIFNGEFLKDIPSLKIGKILEFVEIKDRLHNLKDFHMLKPPQGLTPRRNRSSEGLESSKTCYEFFQLPMEMQILTANSNIEGLKMQVSGLETTILHEKRKREHLEAKVEEMVLSLIGDGMTDEFIMKHTKLPKEQIQEMRKRPKK